MYTFLERTLSGKQIAGLVFLTLSIVFSLVFFILKIENTTISENKNIFSISSNNQDITIEDNLSTYDVGFNNLRDTNELNSLVSNTDIKQVKVQFTDNLQTYKSSWLENNGNHIFYKSYDFEEVGNTLIVYIHIDRKSFEKQGFSTAEIGFEAEFLITQAIIHSQLNNADNVKASAEAYKKAQDLVKANRGLNTLPLVLIY